MSGLMAFATGFLNGSVEVQREKAAKEIADKEAKALAQKEAVDRLATADPTKMSKSVYEYFAAQAGVPLSDVGNMFDDAANSHNLGGFSLQGNFDKINNPNQKAENYLLSWNAQFANQGVRADALKFWETGGDAASALAEIEAYEKNYLLANYAPPQGGTSVKVSLEKSFPELYGFKQELTKFIGGQFRDDVDTTLELHRTKKDIGEHETLVSLPNQDNNFILPTQANEAKQLDNLASAILPEGGTRHHLMSRMAKFSYNEDVRLQAEGMLHAGALLDLGIEDFQKSPDARAAVSEYIINTVSQGDPEANVDKIIAAIYPIYQKNFQVDAMDDLLGNTQKPQDYLGVKRFNDTRGTYEAADNVDVLGERLFKLRSEGKTSGLWRAVTEGIVGLTASTGQLSQFAQTVFNNGVADVNDSRNFITVGDASYTTTTAESIEAIAAANGYSASERIGEMQALEFNLAVQIARAADPSGRLSNQDFENALKQVGRAGVFSSLDSDLAALRTTIEVNKEKKKKLQRVYDITNKSVITRQDKIALEIHETIVKDVIRLNKQNSTAASSTLAPVAPALDVGVISQGLDVTGDYEVPQGTSAFLSDGAMYLVQDGVATLVTNENMPSMRESGAAAQPATSAQPAAPVQPATPAQPAATPTQTSRIDPALFAGKKFTTVGEFRKFEGDETLYKPILENGRIVGYEAQ